MYVLGWHDLQVKTPAADRPSSFGLLVQWQIRADVLCTPLYPRCPLYSSALSASSLPLHLLTDFDVHLEKFGDASVQANRFAFVQLAFTVVRGYTLLRA